MWLLKDKEFLIGLAVIIGGASIMIALLSGVETKAEEASTDCMPLCVIDGIQYLPYPIDGECWCNMRTARVPRLDR